MKRSASGRHLPPSRMDQHVAIEMATGSSATTRLKNALGEQGVAPLNRRGAKHYAPARRHRGVDHPQTVCRNVLDLVRHQCIKRPVKTHIVPHQIEEASLSPEGGVAAERHVDQKILRWLQPGWISAMLSQKGYSTRFGYFTRTAKHWWRPRTRCGTCTPSCITTSPAPKSPPVWSTTCSSRWRHCRFGEILAPRIPSNMFRRERRRQQQQPQAAAAAAALAPLHHQLESRDLQRTCSSRSGPAASTWPKPGGSACCDCNGYESNASTRLKKSPAAVRSP